MTNGRLELVALHRYYIWQNKMREHFEEVLQTDNDRSWGSSGGIMSFLYMSYWYAGLFVVIEGWRALGLEDDEIDDLLASSNVELLRRYRNGVFHYQRNYLDERFVGLIRDGEDVVEWVRALNSAFGRYFLTELRRSDESEGSSADAPTEPTG